MTDASEEEFSEIWETIEVAETVDDVEDVAPTRSIRPSRRAKETSADFAASELPPLTRAEREGRLPEIELRDVLGEGGMGEVRLAWQVALGRDVAVKTLGGEVESSTQPERRVLLRESWVTARLEHPNIVPIYTLGRNEDDEPMLVMKSIEGVSWAEMLADPSTSPRDFDSPDPLDWHLEILSSVCDALHYAHSRGIVHRDVKPENVMIGEFGEVYLLDWGIAVSLEDDPDGYLPSRADVTSPAGTPAYMAPEMAGGEPEELSPRTDVFLLGAVLHEIVTRAPPHEGSTLYQTMLDAYTAHEYDYEAEGVHPDLANICRRAMRRDPEERYEDAEAVRQALAHHVHHRESIRMSREAEERLGDLERMIRKDAPEAKLHEAFGECRFGFEQALRVSEDNDIARRGLQRTLETMAERELEEESYQAASLLIDDLPERNEKLERRLEELGEELESRREEYAELQEMRREEDVDVGREKRSVLILLLGFVWTFMAIFAHRLADLVGMSISPEFYLLHSGLVLAAEIVLAKLFITDLFQNRANRRIAAGLGLVFVDGVLVRALGVIAAMEVHVVMAMEHLVYASTATLLALAVDRRVLLPGLLFFGSSFLVALMPPYAFPIAAVTSAAATSLLAWKWWPGSTEDDDS